jgi:2-polyprenyl-3-methyl-5-hydroxy-6-metoxy-1,4-benzoquinol methylase
MNSLLKTQIKKLINLGTIQMCKREYFKQTFNRFNERPVEFGFVFKKIGEIYPKKILDVGTGTTALPHLMRNCGSIVTAIDNIQDYWPTGMFNRHFHVINDDITKTRLCEKFDLITCISVLEHIENSTDAVINMLSLLSPLGFLILSFPYTEEKYVRNVYDLPNSSYGRGSSYITQSYSRENINNWLIKGQATIVEQEY